MTKRRISARWLVILALRVAASASTNEYLRPFYHSLADFYTNQLEHEFIEGDGI